MTSVDRAIAESLTPLERVILAIIYLMETNRVGIQGSKVFRVLNTYLESQRRDNVSVSSFNNLLKRLSTAGIIRLRTNKKAVNPLEYYWIYREYPESILDAIFEIDGSLKMIRKFL